MAEQQEILIDFDKMSDEEKTKEIVCGILDFDRICKELW